MCYLCEQFGDPAVGDGVWYLNPKNYARHMYKLRAPGEGYKGVEASPETGPEGSALFNVTPMVDAMEKGDRDGFDKALAEMSAHIKEIGFCGQVLPLKDAEKVLELCSPIGLIACLCRGRVRAVDERNELEYTCMGMGVGLLKWERWPERYKGGVKFVNVDEAREWNRKMDKRGFVHSLMPFGAPFIGGFCQCDYPDCLAIRHAVEFGLAFLKGHYVAIVDYDQCNGCGVCVQRCQFGALKFEATSRKANIDQFKCYGCGLCETGCPRGAIKLVDRKSLPALAEVWE